MIGSQQKRKTRENQDKKVTAPTAVVRTAIADNTHRFPSLILLGGGWRRGSIPARLHTRDSGV